VRNSRQVRYARLQARKHPTRLGRQTKDLEVIDVDEKLLSFRELIGSLMYAALGTQLNKAS